MPYEHQFYRTTLQGLFSLDLHGAGTFSYRDKTGYLNLDSVLVEKAKKANLQNLENEKAYRLSDGDRIKRIAALLQGLSYLDGGAKNTVHYTDVSPDILVVAVTTGGNHVFGHVVGPDSQGKPVIKIDALRQVLSLFEKEILSKIYIGWVQGYLDEEHARFEKALQSDDGLLKTWENKIIVDHPRKALAALTSELREHSDWLN